MVGATVGIAPMIHGEAFRLRHYALGALELDDLMSEGWLAYLTAPAYSHGGALRLRIRGAMRDALRREWRALGRVEQTVRWPVYWSSRIHAPGQIARGNYRKPYVVRRCVDCHEQIERISNRKRCIPCARARKTHLERLRQRVA